MVYYIAQLFGTLGLIVMILSLFQKNKNKNVNFYNLQWNIFWMSIPIIKSLFWYVFQFFWYFKDICMQRKRK